MKKTFVIAEDNINTMQFYIETLLSLGVHKKDINYFYDGYSAIEFIENNKLEDAFLLTDYNMPKNSGGEVLKCSFENNFIYRLIRSANSKSYLKEILEKKYNLKNGFIVINKDEPIEILISEIKEYLTI